MQVIERTARALFPRVAGDLLRRSRDRVAERAPLVQRPVRRFRAGSGIENSLVVVARKRGG